MTFKERIQIFEGFIEEISPVFKNWAASARFKQGSELLNFYRSAAQQPGKKGLFLAMLKDEISKSQREYG